MMRNQNYCRRVLRKDTFPYAIRGYKNMIMKLSGKSKRSSFVKALNKHKNTNAANFKVLKEDTGKYFKFYLLKPTNEKIYLGQYEDEDYDEEE